MTRDERERRAAELAALARPRLAFESRSKPFETKDGQKMVRVATAVNPDRAAKKALAAEREKTRKKRIVAEVARRAAERTTSGV